MLDIGNTSERKVLVVDDDIDFADGLSEAVALNGFEVKVVNSAPEARRCVRDWSPQVVLIDNQLGASRGVDLVPELKSQVPDIMCIMITAYSAIDTAIRSIKEGAVDYLRKPITPEEVVKILEGCFEKVRLKRERESAEQALWEREARLQAIMANVADSILMVDQAGIIETANPASNLLFGYSAQSLEGLRLGDLIEGGLGRLEEVSQDAHRVGNVSHQAVAIRNGGTKFTVEIDASVMRFKDRRYYLAAMRDVSERERRKQELEEAREIAEMANRAKSDFLANVSHELRTPLNAIIGFSEMLMAGNHGPLGSDHYYEYAQLIHEGGSHLMAVISDILDVSKIEAGKLILVDEMVDVGELTESAMSLLRGRATRAGIRMGKEIPEDLPKLRVDPRIIKQVLINLLSNAVKFTKEDGWIELAARCREDGGFELTVSDSGVGISPDDIENVMTPFGQVSDPYSKEKEGTGLGLPLAKRLTELHDGELTMESQPGKGTRVTVTLPAGRVVAAT